MAKYMLTTNDNPFNPYENFDSWYSFDVDHGYNTCSYLSRVAYTSDQLSEAENDNEIERAIDEIIKHDPTNMYVKIKVGDD